eukprot:COSAG06_NODE_49967_length_321_cov_54.752252_1_plen_58_part_10
MIHALLGGSQSGRSAHFVLSDKDGTYATACYSLIQVSSAPCAYARIEEEVAAAKRGHS